MTLNEQSKNRIKEVFKAVYEANEQAKLYNDSAKDMKSSLAKELELNKEIVNNAYSLWVKRLEKPEITSQTDELLGYLF